MARAIPERHVPVQQQAHTQQHTTVAVLETVSCGETMIHICLKLRVLNQILSLAS